MQALADKGEQLAMALDNSQGKKEVRGLRADEVAVAWLLHHPANIVPIIGTTLVNRILVRYLSLSTSGVRACLVALLACLLVCACVWRTDGRHGSMGQSTVGGADGHTSIRTNPTTHGKQDQSRPPEMVTMKEEDFEDIMSALHY